MSRAATLLVVRSEKLDPMEYHTDSVVMMLSVMISVFIDYSPIKIE